MESKEVVKVVGFWVSPYSLRVEWALRLKGVEYEYIEEDIFNQTPLLSELNPVHKKVPVLIHGEKVTLESLIILEYIDETWKQFPLLPEDPYDRAMARFLADLGEKLFVNAFVALLSEGDEKERTLKLATEAMEKIEEELKGKTSKFFGGENMGYLDLALGWISHWLPVWEEVGCMKIVDPIQFPATTVWMENFLNHPVIKEKLPPTDKMVIYFQWLRKEMVSLIAKYGPNGAWAALKIKSRPNYR
jgi:glutathione S-transferase